MNTQLTLKEWQEQNPDVPLTREKLQTFPEWHAVRKQSEQTLAAYQKIQEQAFLELMKDETVFRRKPK